MLTENMTAAEVLEKYRDDVYRLAAYLPWLTEKSGTSVSSVYRADGEGRPTVAFPVYDATLLKFVKEAQATGLMDRNYHYVMSRNRLRDAADVRNFISNLTILQMDQWAGVLSYYVLGGQTKSRLWSEGMSEGIFLDLVEKAKELIDFWTNAEVTKGEQSE
ncbi:MAG: hypothetical protein K5662_02675 [Lachnospiraceae bacterium]|nr:hypothetical protein [Lachnospiraceae bacterium]